MKCVTFLSDFGLKDSYVAEVKGVILSRVPDAMIIDITHEIPPHDINEGAFQLFRSYYYFPTETIHLAVVDPGVGSSRKAIVAKVADRLFVGPDNGLLRWAISDCEKRSKTKAVAWELPKVEEASATFHGRDIFAPFVVKCLFGQVLSGLREVNILGNPFPDFQLDEGKLKGQIISIDHFGNLVTNIPSSIGVEELQLGERIEDILPVSTYADIPAETASLVAGSHGFWEIASFQKSAAQYLKARVGELVRGVSRNP